LRYNLLAEGRSSQKVVLSVLKLPPSLQDKVVVKLLVELLRGNVFDFLSGWLRDQFGLLLLLLGRTLFCQFLHLNVVEVVK